MAAALAAVIFVAAQTLSILHAQKYGDDAHTHNGVQCLIVSAAADNDDGLAPSFVAALAIAFIVAAAFSQTPALSRVQARRRYRPRAPPLR
ncbi:MAG: hypothetical protein AAGJ73_11515 [Pseudomonadota bacterium]